MSEAKGAGVKHRAQALDIVRAAAALAVLTYHVWLYRLPRPNSPTRDGWVDFALFELRAGLIVFFVMSGYLLYRPLLRGGRDGAPRTVPLAAYYWRRVVRIVPGYYLAIAGSVLLLWSLDGTPGVRLPDAADLWKFLFFLQNYYSDTLLTLDAPTWTLAVQAAFYLVFPFFLIPASRLGARAWVVPVVLIVFGLAWNWYSYSNALGPIARLAMPAMLPYLALGMLIAHLPPFGTRATAVRVLLAGVALAVANGVWHALGEGEWALGVLRDLPGAIGYALIIAACAQPVIGFHRRLRPAEAFGRWSYGVFLWHLPLLLFIKGHGLMPGSGLATWALLIAVAAAAGATQWRFVERPLLARSRGSS
ncbi:MAG: acyltransferase [Actinobacteria bacterium]|nr:acyltransferase [Actinomycetota bacterium]